MSVAGGLALSIPQSIAHTKLLERAADVKDEYDYIVVGGGTAGLTVADRLTESGECELPYRTAQPARNSGDQFTENAIMNRYRVGD